MTDTEDSNRQIIADAFEGWHNGTMRDSKVIDGTALYESISFDDLWQHVEIP